MSSCTCVEFICFVNVPLLMMSSPTSIFAPVNSNLALAVVSLACCTSCSRTAPGNSPNHQLVVWLSHTDPHTHQGSLQRNLMKNEGPSTAGRHSPG